MPIANLCEVQLSMTRFGKDPHPRCPPRILPAEAHFPCRALGAVFPHCGWGLLEPQLHGGSRPFLLFLELCEAPTGSAGTLRAKAGVAARLPPKGPAFGLILVFEESSHLCQLSNVCVFSIYCFNWEGRSRKVRMWPECVPSFFSTMALWGRYD